MKGSKNKSKSPSEVPMNESLDGKVQRVEREIAKRDKRIAQLEMDREIRKRAAAHSTREGKRVRFAFVHAERANFPVAALCRILGVTRQGYYAFIKREPSERVVRDAVFRDRVRAIHDENQKRYGRPRVIEQLRREGVRSSKRRVERGLLCRGLLCRGFAFSGKGRGFCPSCKGRRMCATAAHLINDVLPEVALRPLRKSASRRAPTASCGSR